jgi:hypothetical protein
MTPEEKAKLDQWQELAENPGFMEAWTQLSRYSLDVTVQRTMLERERAEFYVEIDQQRAKLEGILEEYKNDLYANLHLEALNMHIKRMKFTYAVIGALGLAAMATSMTWLIKHPTHQWEGEIYFQASFIMTVFYVSWSRLQYRRVGKDVDRLINLGKASEEETPEAGKTEESVT